MWSKARGHRLSVISLDISYHITAVCKHHLLVNSTRHHSHWTQDYKRTCVTTSCVIGCDWAHVRSLKDIISRLMKRTAATKLSWSQFCFCRSPFFAFAHVFKMHCSIEHKWQKHFLLQWQIWCECSLRRIRLYAGAEGFLLFREMPTLTCPVWRGSSLVTKALNPLTVPLGPLNRIKSNNYGTLWIGLTCL